jgi:hypothetical protein
MVDADEGEAGGQTSTSQGMLDSMMGEGVNFP